jgi:SAM-dependent methyltransferase
MPENVWEYIYTNKVWSENNDSGHGSIVYNALPWLAYLNAFIAANDISSVLDLGSGDGRMFAELDLRGASYTGIEASSLAIKLFEDANPDAEYTLIHSNLLDADYPQVDLIIVKDVLMHNPVADINKILTKIKQSCKYALFCEMYPDKEYADIPAGQFRPISLADPAFDIEVQHLFQYGNLGHHSYPHHQAVWLYSASTPASLI